MKDWTKEWFTAKELLSMSTNWDNWLTFHDKICPDKQILTTFGPEKSLKSSTAIELLRELPELVSRTSYNLDGISTGIYQILQDKYDALAQAENL